MIYRCIMILLKGECVNKSIEKETVLVLASVNLIFDDCRVESLKNIHARFGNENLLNAHKACQRRIRKQRCEKISSRFQRLR